MGGLFSSPQSSYSQVGGLPGYQTAGTNMLNAVQSNLSNPNQLPYMGVYSNFLGPTGNAQASQNIANYLSPSFLTNQSPGMQQLFSAWTSQSNQEKNNALSNTAMNYGVQGSPELGALGNTAFNYDNALNQRIAQTQLGQYNTNLGLQANMSQLPLNIAGQQQNAYAQLMQQLQSGVGLTAPQTVQNSYGPSPFSQLLSPILQGAAGSIFGL